MDKNKQKGEWTPEDRFIYEFKLLYTGRNWDDKRTPETWEDREKGLREIFRNVAGDKLARADEAAEILRNKGIGMAGQDVLDRIEFMFQYGRVKMNFN